MGSIKIQFMHYFLRRLLNNSNCYGKYGLIVILYMKTNCNIDQLGSRSYKASTYIKYEGIIKRIDTYCLFCGAQAIRHLKQKISFAREHWCDLKLC